MNLAPGFDRPQDVYSEVALRVREMIAADAKYEPTEEEKQAAAVRNGEFNHRCPVIRKQMAALFPPELVERKTVKQTVMTTVYGVTPYGASIQVRNRIKEKHPDAYTDEQTSHISRYITPKIFDALRNMFSGAREIQDWLAVAATQVAKSVSRERVNKTRAMESQAKLMRKRAKLKGLELDKASKTSVSLNSDSSVIWTTPLGLTVIQPYRAEKRYAVGKIGAVQHAILYSHTHPSTHPQVRTFTQSVTLKNTHLRSPVNVVKQRAAFPPNFIHSLDATHMLMTAITCGEMTENPITFAAVHDSYWTHACDVERLRDILRDEFVKMHSQPVMQQLYDEFVERYKDRLVQRIVPIDRDAPVKVEEGEEVVSPEELSQEQLAEAVIAKADADAIAMGESASASTFLGSLHDDLVDSDEPTSASAEDPLLLGLGEEEEELIDTVPEEKPRKISKNQKYVRRWEPVQFPPLPKRGTFNIADVAKSEYFFN